jgi:hypothetical protein
MTPTRLCKELQGYAQNNRDSITNYHRRYHGKQPVSSSRAEGCVDEIANARMGRSSACASHPEAPIVSRWSEWRSWMGASNRAVSFRWRHSQTSVFPLPSTICGLFALQRADGLVRIFAGIDFKESKSLCRSARSSGPAICAGR